MNYKKEIEELKSRISLLEKIILTGNDKEVANQNKKESTHDKTRYLFNGKILPKNRLVLSVITEYFKQNNPTFEQLQRVFDKSLQGSLNVVEKLTEVEKIKDYAKRYFVKPNEQLTLRDCEIVVVCTQWGIFNIVKFLKVASSLGYVIETVKTEKQ